MIGWVRVMLGVILVWGAFGVLGYRLGWQIHSNRGENALLREERGSLDRSGTCTAAGTPTADGQLAGVLSLPKLSVVAPVEAGTGDAELNVAVGHADSTPWPGTPGTAVLLAHDVSYFANIDQLVPGDVIDYRVGCTTYVFHVTGHQVVAAGSAIPQLAGDALVMDTCWPTNALWFTPNRYLVEAQEVTVDLSKTSTNAVPQSWPTDYASAAPPALVAQGLTLSTNYWPMGTMTLAGTPDSTWAQSPAPLAVEAAALAAYFGGLHAADQQRGDWWTDLAPGLSMPAPLSGAWVSGRDAPLDVTIDTVGSTPTSVTLGTELTLSGGSAPGRYLETVSEAINGVTVVITNWKLEAQ